MSLTRKQRMRIAAIWDELEAEDDDASTEHLFAMTCDLASEEFGAPIDAGDVTEALAMYGLQ